MQRHLATCSSSPHRAILGLLPVALGRPVPEGLEADLAASEPKDLVALAAAHYVQPLVNCAFANAPDLAGSVPEDLVVYFREIQAANARRNQAIAAQLQAIGDIASAGELTAVALKGAAELLAPRYPAPGARLLSDTDILLGPEDLARLRQALLDRGAREDRVAEINQRGHHHLPPLHLPGWPAPVELHRGLGLGAADSLLPAAEMLETALPACDTGLRVPSDAHRLVHAVIHAQLGQTDRPATPGIGLRDAMDFALLADRLAADDLSRARERFVRAGQADAFDRLSALAGRLIDADGTRQAGWVDQALAGFGAPDRIRRQSDLNWLRHYASGFLRDRERRRHYLKMLGSWHDLRRVWAFHRERRRRFR